jgi:O-acetyl-ADP-ribose deacetylase (regulator of RNase III)
MTEFKRNGKVLRVFQGDLTAQEVEAIVIPAAPDLKLGTGFGGAATQRGGPSIQEELGRHPTPVLPGKAILTGAGRLKARALIHAVVPQFHEPEEEAKLREAVRAALDTAEEAGIRHLAFPALGAGFWGVSLDLCSRVLVEEALSRMKNSTRLEGLNFCLVDNREVKAFARRLEELTQEDRK